LVPLYAARIADLAGDFAKSNASLAGTHELLSPDGLRIRGVPIAPTTLIMDLGAVVPLPRVRCEEGDAVDQVGGNGLGGSASSNPNSFILARIVRSDRQRKSATSSTAGGP